MKYGTKLCNLCSIVSLSNCHKNCRLDPLTSPPDSVVISAKLQNLKLELATEMSEELQKLKLYFSEHFQNASRRKLHHNCSEIQTQLLLTQRHHEKCLKREVELKLEKMKDDIFLEIQRNKSGSGKIGRAILPNEVYTPNSKRGKGQ